MKYNLVKFQDIDVEARYSVFDECQQGVETYIILQGTDPTVPLDVQLSNLEEAEERILGDSQGTVIFSRYFLSDPTNQASNLPAQHEGAVSVIGQAPLSGVKIAMLIYVRLDTKVIVHNNGVVEADCGDFSQLWYTGAAMPDLDPREATRQLLFDYEAALSAERCNVKDCCMRTWFFVRDIDTRYRGVVDGRNEAFARLGLTRDTHFIASTGIEGNNADTRSLVTMDTLALKGIPQADVHYLKASSHLNPTMEYGVAFERGTAIDLPDRRHIIISGTASIDNNGEILYPGEVDRQAGRMIENVQALLAEGGASLSDVTHIIIYLRDEGDYASVHSIMEMIFPDTPYVIVKAPVCRPGWLIEMECTAILKR